MRRSGGQHSTRLMPTNQRIRLIPAINKDVWAFSIGGLVRHPLILSYNDLLRQPTVTLPVSLICTDRRSIDTAEYTGVPLSALFDLVDLDPNATNVLIHGYDGYSTILSLEDFREQAVIAYMLDGETLTHDQGFPARLVIPGRFGYKMPKWVTRVEATAHESGGFWESRGFDRDGIANAVEITAHETLANGMIRLHGFVYSPSTPVLELQIAVDRGNRTSFPLEANQTRWQVDWTPPYPNGVFQFDLAVGVAPRRANALSSRPYTIHT